MIGLVITLLVIAAIVSLVDRFVVAIPGGPVIAAGLCVAAAVLAVIYALWVLLIIAVVLACLALALHARPRRAAR